MKYLLLLLISFNAFAQVRLTIKYNDPKYVASTIEAPSEAEAKDILVNLVANSSRLKGSWSKNSSGSIHSKEQIISIDPETEEETTETVYFTPENFTISIENIAAEIQNKAIEEAIERKVKCGMDSIKFIAKNNLSKGLTNAQIKEMSVTYSVINGLLMAGAIDTALIDIEALQPDGILINATDKVKIIEYINNCNN
jgi:hypothetical protein